jgi:hypothetical protein
MPIVRPILEYGASCWDPYREGRINALDRMQKKAAKFVNYANISVWETLAQRRKIARICAVFKAYVLLFYISFIPCFLIVFVFLFNCYSFCAVSFLFLNKSADHCHRLATQLQ